MPTAGRRAVFLDRDGTLIVDRHYLADPAGVELMPGAAEAVARLNEAAVPAVLVTNQSGIGRGYFAEADFASVQDRVVELLARGGARLDGVYHCPHAPEDGCECRKPELGMFLQAARDLSLSLRGSYFVGDRPRDVQPAARFGGTGILVPPDAAGTEESVLGDWIVVADIGEAVNRVLTGPEAMLAD